MLYVISFIKLAVRDFDVCFPKKIPLEIQYDEGEQLLLATLSASRHTETKKNTSTNRCDGINAFEPVMFEVQERKGRERTCRGITLQGNDEGLSSVK